MLDLSRERRRMVDVHLRRRGIHDREILAAMREVPRETFVDPGFEEFAYEDGPLPIAEGQTISQPYIVAFMLEMAEIGPGDHVLEVGTGSGYAAAVMSRIVDHVYTMERHAGLAETARRRFETLGYRNIEVRTGDGTKGWPEAAPFDAIVVAASGPGAPLALQQQLDVGGKLVIPVGDDPDEQRLLKVTRTGASTYSEEDFGAVRFVPLIGEEGWQEDNRIRTSRISPLLPARSLPQMIAAAAEPLPEFDDPAFVEAFDRFADRRIVLLGEASHGTSEFYRARAWITRRLIEKHGFTIVAAEADWPDAAAIDRYVRHRPPSPRADMPFQRFPTWMWRNAEFAAFVEWLRAHNEQIETPASQAGFYGLDIYNMRASIAAVLEYLDRIDPEAASIARERYGCLTPWQHEPATYGRAALTRGYRECEEAVLRQCRDMLSRQLDHAGQDGDELFDAAQNARLIAAAEHYYRVMYYGRAQSWNLRDTHMFETLQHVIEARSPDAKAVVWAHNSHIGDARFTEMGIVRDEVNIGQLCRQRFGDDVALIGFGTHAGTVAAAKHWDGEMEIMSVRPSREDSYERLCHDAGTARFLLDLGADPALHDRLTERRLERFIGVIYRPETELHSHYADASLARQFDAFVWFDETTAVTPFGPEHATSGVPDTYPFGV
ncbi:protein-L-isoaspartate(D-aspartate) O-methyltransferase [Mesorhizobium sp. WSM3873]|uniref:protein-L-isoaspartate(D-aspartate) O-methyltransferase n=1 Tax=Mesorhizobium sp. WSM3873 TaxID=1854056 RepID=UPI0007FFFC6C|nr:protein-L-isoaspartate(D-aspartate) O-methyltransferase [Mesorhizobium sp. WSM3873]OBQ85999.1 protein-L-isoaspartate O-methyltransferase [Mesorhizobium sp. WSM3873]